MGMILKAMLYYGFPLKQTKLRIDSIIDAWRKEKAPKPPKREKTSDAVDALAQGIAFANSIDRWSVSTQNVEITWVGVGNDSDKLIVYVPGLTYYAFEGDSSKTYSELISNDALAEAAGYIKEFCEKANIPYEPPGWHLTARYC